MKLFRRSSVNRFLTLGGVIIILLQVMFLAYDRYQVSVVLGGILLNQVGVWGLASRLLPERRVYLELRNEVDSFIGLVRELNAHAVQGSTSGVDATKSAMKQSVDRMGEAAAVEN